MNALCEHGTEEFPMNVGKMKLSSRALGRVAAVMIAGAGLAGCVYYPSGGYAAGYGYAPGYYAPAPEYYAPPVSVVVGGGWGWGGGYGRHWR
jgi:hypothetical protein